MMDTMQTILERKSYRGKYVADPVPREHLQAILEAGLAAPSGCNKQTPASLLWTILRCLNRFTA